MSKKSFINLSYLVKVDIANLNSGEGGGGNITPLKKIQSYKGDDFVYVSGQAIRRYLKETLMQLGASITAVDKKGEPDISEFVDKDKVDMKGLFKKYVDLDLFGYMFTIKGSGSSRRWSPVKVSPLVSLFPYKGEKDFLTRKKASDEKSDGNIVQTEIDTFNLMHGSIIIDTDKIGRDLDEFTYQVREQYLDDRETDLRINLLLDAIKNLNGGAKQARLLQDISPRFLVAIRQKTANPFLLNSIKVDENYSLDFEAVIASLLDNKEIIESAFVGLTDRNLFSNDYEDIKKKFTELGFVKVGTVGEALESVKQ
ncbi:MAG: type I-B CRISPR-associated protein Cas7/Cst2/DevR [Candidatus Dojkabacteria bacterium]